LSGVTIPSLGTKIHAIATLQEDREIISSFILNIVISETHLAAFLLFLLSNEAISAALILHFLSLAIVV
jgi:hypothetical protein